MKVVIDTDAIRKEIKVWYTKKEKKIIEEIKKGKKALKEKVIKALED